jgi:hypothetical protein
MSHLNYFIFEQVKKNTFAKSLRIIVWYFLPPKVSLSSQKYGVGSRIQDPGSGKNLHTDPESWGSQGHWIPDPRSATLILP